MTIVKASRKSRVNMSAAAGTGYSVTVYSVTSNRTFILTDLMFETNDSGEGLKLLDNAGSVASPTAGTEKIVFYSNPVRITDIQNGPEFENNVGAVLIGNRALPTYTVFVGGFER